MGNSGYWRVKPQLTFEGLLMRIRKTILMAGGLPTQEDAVASQMLRSALRFSFINAAFPQAKAFTAFV